MLFLCFAFGYGIFLFFVFFFFLFRFFLLSFVRFYPYAWCVLLYCECSYTTQRIDWAHIRCCCCCCFYSILFHFLLVCTFAAPHYIWIRSKPNWRADVSYSYLVFRSLCSEWPYAWLGGIFFWLTLSDIYTEFSSISWNINIPEKRFPISNIHWQCMGWLEWMKRVDFTYKAKHSML